MILVGDRNSEQQRKMDVLSWAHPRFCSSIFARLTVVTNRHTHTHTHTNRQTDNPSYVKTSVEIGFIQLVLLWALKSHCCDFNGWQPDGKNTFRSSDTLGWRRWTDEPCIACTVLRRRRWLSHTGLHSRALLDTWHVPPHQSPPVSTSTAHLHRCTPWLAVARRRTAATCRADAPSLPVTDWTSAAPPAAAAGTGDRAYTQHLAAANFMSGFHKWYLGCGSLSVPTGTVMVP